MSRGTRVYSELGIYHIMFRGVNKQTLFLDDFDYKVMVDYMREVKKQYPFEIYAYCLMSNHVHFLVKENKLGDISIIMKKILVKYALYFNNKYDRCGHLFESRYKSKPIDTNDYLFASLRYIHLNPVKAMILEKPEDYRWSSYHEYVHKKDGLTDKAFVMGIVDLKALKRMHIELEEAYDPFDVKGKKLNELTKYILKKYGIEPSEIKNVSRKEKKVIFNDLLQSYSCSDIANVTGINRATVFRYKEN